MSITLTGDSETGTVTFTGDIALVVDDYPAILALGDGTVFDVDITEGVVTFAIVKTGRATVEIEDADPDGPTPGTQTVTIDGFVPWVMADLTVYDGMAPIEDPTAGIETAREGVLQHHNTAGHGGRSSVCIKDLCGVTRTVRAAIAQDNGGLSWEAVEVTA